MKGQSPPPAKQRFKTYPAYKDSGVEWLGPIPASWDVRRLKMLISEPITDGPHETPEFLTDGVPFLSVDGIQEGELIFDGCRYISEAAHRAYQRKCAPRRDDILLGKAASTGKIARVKVDFEFSVWSPLALIRPNHAEVWPGFLEYALKSTATQAQIEVLCTSNTQKNISMRDIPILVVSVAGFQEQRAIAAFLDRETARIDALVAKKERLIKLLQEKRTALITRAVTKGLDPTVPMKDSGVEWLGKIPAHWDAAKMWRISTAASGGTPSKEESGYWGGDIPWVSPKDMKRRFIDSSEDRITQRALAETAITLIAPPVVLIVVRGMILVHTFPIGITTVPVTINQDMKALRFQQGIEPMFLVWLFEGVGKGILGAVVEEAAHGTRVIRMDRWRTVVAPIPPEEEQDTICSFLDQETAKIDILAAKVRDAIARLKELRTALISAAVTGKIDLREEAA